MRAAEKGEGLRGKGCEEQLRVLGFFGPEQRRLRNGFMVAYSSSW